MLRAYLFTRLITVFQRYISEPCVIVHQNNFVPSRPVKMWNQSFRGSYIGLSALLLALLVVAQFSAQSMVQASTDRASVWQETSSQAADSPTTNNDEPPPALSLEKSAITNDTDSVPGEIIVIFHQNLTRSGATSAAGIVESVSGSVVETLDLSGIDAFLADGAVADSVAVSVAVPVAPDAQLIRVPEGGEADVIEQLRANPLVAYAMPNRIVRASGRPAYGSPFSHFSAAFSTHEMSTANDTANSDMEVANYEVDDPYFATQWYMGRIKMLETWALTLQENGSPNQMSPVKVAIIDSGIDHTHPEFSGRIAGGKNYFEPGTLPVDDYGHGTHVAGLIGASVNNGIGIAGVAPWVELMPYKTLDAAGNGTVSNVTQAIRDATNSGAQIINLSLETGAPDALMKAAIDYAVSKDVLLIASVGNLAPVEVRWPAKYPEVMGVAATDGVDQYADYSCTGVEVELAAPGGTNTQPIQSTWSSFAECPGRPDVDPEIGAYCYARGTSMATGLVTGAAALMLGVQPELSADEVRAHLNESVTPLLLQEPTQIGNGLLNAYDGTRFAVTSDLNTSPVSNIETLPLGSDPYRVTIVMNNPSLSPIEWEANWLKKSWITSTTPISGVLTNVAPNTLQFIVTPTDLEVGRYSSIVTLTGSRVDGSQVTQRIAVNLDIEDGTVNRPLPTPTWTPTQPAATPTAVATATSVATATAVATAIPVGTPTMTATPEPPSGVSSTPTAIATATATPAPTLALDIDYSTTEVKLKRSDKPYQLLITLDNQEPESVLWQVSSAPVVPSGQGSLSVGGTIQGTIPPNGMRQVTVMIDPMSFPMGDYTTQFNVDVEGQTSTRSRSVSTNLLLTIERGQFQVMLPAVLE